MIRHFGAVGTGPVFKLINNLMGAVQIASLAEGVAMAEQAGLDMNRKRKRWRLARWQALK